MERTERLKKSNGKVKKRTKGSESKEKRERLKRGEKRREGEKER